MKSKTKKFNWVIARVMTVIMALTLLPNVSLVNVQATERTEAKNADYEIYPIPQSVEYNEGTVNLSNEVNVVFENGVDEATQNRLMEVLAIKGIESVTGTEIVEGKTNFLVGINNSNGVVDNYFKANNLSDDAHFENFDSHIVSAKDNIVAVLGRDTDSAFYGITTLKLIFKQLETQEMRNLLIKDFSDGQWRGFIEGYYGIPWSNENRMSLMEFGGDFKMNAYIFAPKDDEYHSLKWREPYPAEKLAEIEEMVGVGAATKNKFIWTIHPFLKDGMNFSTDEAYQEDLAKIIAKFEQLYSIGVRQFGVLADDAEGEADDQVRLMNDLEAWRLSKGDVYNLIFVPKVYTKESAGGDVNNAYLKTIGTMPETVDIMWTGDVILGYVTQDTFEFFEEAVGRQAFMWLNWPVNDINNKRLLMGKGEMLDPEVNNFKGIVTNPMQEAQASKVSLFAIADYGWNRADFDMDKSWADSFKYIEPDAADELHTFAKHMSDPAPNWHGLALEESEELRPVIEEFTRKLFRKEPITEYSKVVLAEYQEILDATNTFAQKSQNDLLKNEIKGWIDSLRDIAESTMAYVNAAVALEKGNADEAIKYYVQGEDEYTASRSHRVPAINDGQTRPEPGTRHLIPFAKDLSRLIGERVTQLINPDTLRLSLFPYTNMGYQLYWGHVQNIVDGDNARLSTMWIRGAAKEGDYVALELSDVTNVNSIIFEHGEPGAGDAFNFVKFQSSMDGENWTDINDIAYGPSQQKIVIEDLDVDAKYVRVMPTGEMKNNWISVREFSVNKDDVENIKRNVYTNVESLESNKVSIYPDHAAIAGLNGVTLAENQYVGIKLDKIREITNIIAEVTNSDKLALETSVNGVEWTAVADKANKVAARYVRFVNKSKEAVTVDVTNLAVEYSNNDVRFDIRPAAEAKFEPGNLVDGKLNTAFKPQVNAPKTGSLVYKVSENTDITNITIVQNPSTISDAVVSVRTENGWSEVGTLAKNVNTFETAQFSNVFEIKVAWDGVAPTLHEIGTSTAKAPVEEVNKEELVNVIAKAEALKSEDYTAETWATLEASLKAAKEVLANSEATQEEVNAAVASLNKAIEALVKKPEGGNNGGNNNGGNNNGGNNNGGNNNGGNNNGGSNNGGSNNGNKPTKPGKGDGSLPNTGGQSAAAVLALGGILSAAGVTLRKKRK
ncbi:beta-N-acetylglucosaminidase domain-containing protein [Clostridium sp.]|uniref:beta-N-acetylglucosaminidase domain-containing protein n=1 Tax=Clostridium sp. TaxID=1506 RepID=UPI003F3E0A70